MGWAIPNTAELAHGSQVEGEELLADSSTSAAVVAGLAAAAAAVAEVLRTVLVGFAGSWNSPVGYLAWMWLLQHCKSEGCWPCHSVHWSFLCTLVPLGGVRAGWFSEVPRNSNGGRSEYNSQSHNKITHNNNKQIKIPKN